MGKLSNKVALITGGNSGIGLATAQLFKEEGATVIITAQSEKTREKAILEFGDRFDVVQADVSKMSDLDKLFAHIKNQYGKLDVLFANAGIGPTAMTSEVTEEYFESLFNTNVMGVYFSVAKALPFFNPGSAVVLNASVLSSLGRPGQSVYSATKAAVRSFARSWTSEIPIEKVRFNVVSPGLTNTSGLDKAGLTEEMKDNIATMIPIKRLAKPEEIAKAVLFLVSSDSSYIAGVEMYVDGGAGQI
jgi:NAD(P)-dependent dehydrogenase (short-subunit alcohol dehydrogenase family)